MPAPHLNQLAQLIGNDSHAATFQSLGQYRSALLKEIVSIQHEQPAGVAVPDGWKLVPVEPAPAILNAIDLLCDDHSAFNDSDAFWRYLLAAAPHPVSGEQNPERWFAACGDHRDTLIAIHGERSGHIASGIPESQAHDLIKAHNAGVPESAHRRQHGEQP
ncbi:hypothetical protein K8U54_17775 [Pseudomonas fulva]|uniref:hypothetical protein n=1 Tax=Pseudomonas fulva TaxID=47880 RepID=UPI00201E0114|nr:hypothetical protein [Pseudomonas fulva]UQY33553.1 hypothetical protein K8U54_17775 [Pseudomonas fulva]